MLGIMVGYPWMALVPGLALLGLGAWSRSRNAQSVGILWLLYCGYEYAMKARILCSGECNIRVDLLLIYPILLFGSIAALVNVKRRRAAA